MGKQNCWEHLRCGREPGGMKTYEFGVCPAATDTSRDGINGGRKGGRYCWKVGGTFCGGEIQPSVMVKMPACVACDFFKAVRAEEGEAFRH